MILCPQTRMGFIHNHKTGGCSVEQWLIERCPQLRIDGHRHQTTQQALTKIGMEGWEYLYTFGFVRNPWERLVSWWSMIHERPDDCLDDPLWMYVRANATNFTEFLYNCTEEVQDWGDVTKSVVRPQLHYFTDASGKVIIDYIGRFETLQKDLDTIAIENSLPPGPVPRHNSSKIPKDYRDYYTDETRRLVAKRFAPDIETFKYTFKERPLAWHKR